MTKKKKRKRSRQLQLIAILLMLLLIAVCLAWLTLRGRALNRSHTAEMMKTLESAQQKVSEGTAAAEELAAGFKVAQHVYSHRGSDPDQSKRVKMRK